MRKHIECPGCGEAEDLRGEESPEGIRIRCGKCDMVWLRDGEPEKCATCGGTEVEERPRALTQYSRGTQLSIVGFSKIPLCRTCDARMIEKADTGRAVPFNYKPAALDPQAASDREEGKAGDEGLITP